MGPGKPFYYILLPAVISVLLLGSCAGAPSEAGPEREESITFQGEGQWYRGDLHCHSRHSDGDAPISEVIAYAEKTGLDFFAVTDHDTSMEGEPTHWIDPAYTSDTMVLLYGVEWTSKKGHANIFASRPFPYRRLWQANRELDPRKAIDAAHDVGAFFSINHPTGPSRKWEYPVPLDADFIEVWNAPFVYPSRNREAVSGLWDTLLKNGHRIPGVGGSDSHDLYGFEREFNPPGRPTTWVYADAPTPEAVLEGIKAGRVTISYAPAAERFELTADCNGDGHFETLCGDSVDAPGPADSQKVTLKMAVVPSLPADSMPEADRGKWLWPAYTAVLYRDGKPIERITLQENRERAVTVDVTVPPGKRVYYRAELHGTPWGSGEQKILYGRTLAVTNPIYFGYE